MDTMSRATMGRRVGLYLTATVAALFVLAPTASAGIDDELEDAYDLLVTACTGEDSERAPWFWTRDCYQAAPQTVPCSNNQKKFIDNVERRTEEAWLDAGLPSRPEMGVQGYYQWYEKQSADFYDSTGLTRPWFITCKLAGTINTANGMAQDGYDGTGLPRAWDAPGFVADAAGL